MATGISKFYEMLNDGRPAKKARRTMPRSAEALDNARTIVKTFHRLAGDNADLFRMEASDILFEGLTRALIVARKGNEARCKMLAEECVIIGDVDKAIARIEAQEAEEKRRREWAELDNDPATRREGLSGNRMSVLNAMDDHMRIMEDKRSTEEERGNAAAEYDRLYDLLMTDDYQ